MQIVFFFVCFFYVKKWIKNVERKNLIIENYFVIMKKIKKIKMFMVESERIFF